MKRLLSINSYHYRRGGADIAYFNHAELFARHGWETSYFSMQHKKNVECKDSAYFADSLEYGSGEGRTLSNAMKIVYSSEARAKLSQLLDDNPPDIAHVHSIYHHLSPSVLMELRQRRIPVVMTTHDLKIACPNYKMLNSSGICERCKGGKIWNVVLHRCIKDSYLASGLIALESAIHKTIDAYNHNVDRIITPSRFYRQKLIDWGWSPEKLIYIPNFVPALNFQPAKGGGDFILYFGRLSSEKGLVTLVKAARSANVSVVIAGQGPQESELLCLAQELQAPVRFVGFKQGDELWALVDQARAIVLPSEWYENSPLSVLEAFQRGKPLIGSRIGGISELVEEGDTGWLFQPGNVEKLADLLKQVSEMSKSRLGNIGLACQEFVALHHSEAEYYRCMAELYRGLRESNISAGAENARSSRSTAG